MSKIKYERGKTMVYPGHYPRLLVTPVFAHEGDFMWVEKIVCMYDANLDDVEEPEFEFHRDTAHYEKNDALQAENAKLRELVRDYHRYEHEDCYACRYINECRADESGRCIAPMRLGERYRELGVDV